MPPVHHGERGAFFSLSENVKRMPPQKSLRRHFFETKLVVDHIAAIGSVLRQDGIKLVVAHRIGVVIIHMGIGLGWIHCVLNCLPHTPFSVLGFLVGPLGAMIFIFWCALRWSNPSAHAAFVHGPGPVFLIQAACNIRANLLMCPPPLTFGIDEVGAITLPKPPAAAMLTVPSKPVHHGAGRQIPASGGQAIVRHLDDR